MTQTEFLILLKERGFPDPVLVEYPANGSLDRHEHPFEALALVIDGSLVLTVNNVETEYKVGDTFHLKYQEQHQERYGPNGVKYLAGRK